MAAHTKAFFNALIWRFLGTIGVGLTRFSFTVVLARLLNPGDFGIFGYAMLFISFALIISDLGLRAAIVQRYDLDERHISTVCTLSVVAACVVCFFLCLYSYFFLQGIQSQVFMALSLVPLVTSLGLPQSAILERNMDFRTLQIIEAVSAWLSYAIAVLMALAGHGVWSLVCNAISATALYALMCVFVCRTPHLHFSGFKQAKGLLKFGIGNTLARIANYFSSKGDSFVVGLCFPSEALGGYNMASQFATLPSNQSVSVITGVLFPYYASLQLDARTLNDRYLAILQVTALILIPFSAYFSVIMPEALLLVLGSKWTDYTQPAQVLCFAGLFGALYTQSDCLLRARGIVYKQSAVHGAFGFILLVAATLGSRFGLTAVATAVTVCLFCKHFALAKTIHNETRLGWGQFLRAHAWGVWVGAFVMMSCQLLAFFCRLKGFQSYVTVTLVTGWMFLIVSLAVTIMLSRIKEVIGAAWASEP